jgi:predicted nucleic-acid-binding Zn-ribbon protein
MAMKDGICLKCGGKEVYANTPDRFQGRHGLPITAAQTASIEFYVCGECGYAESYVAEARDLQKIRDYWSKVGNGSQKRSERGNLPLPVNSPQAVVEHLPTPAKRPPGE